MLDGAGWIEGAAKFESFPRRIGGGAKLTKSLRLLSTEKTIICDNDSYGYVWLNFEAKALILR